MIKQLAYVSILPKDPTMTSRKKRRLDSLDITPHTAHSAKRRESNASLRDSSHCPKRLANDIYLKHESPRLPSVAPSVDNLNTTSLKDSSDGPHGGSELVNGHDRDAENGCNVTGVFYKVDGIELVEDEDLQIIGETEIREQASDDDPDDIPVRVLSDFSVYDSETQQLIRTEQLLALIESDNSPPPDCHYRASGSVQPFVDDDDEDDNDDENRENSLEQDTEEIQRVALSPIIEFNIHHVSDETGMDGKIYLRTKYAWYILDKPAKQYAPFFESFWIKHRILHLTVASSIANPRITFSVFIEDLKVTAHSPLDIATTVDMLGREISKEDVLSDDVRMYVLSMLGKLGEQDIKLGRVPLIRYLFDTTQLPRNFVEREPGRTTELSNVEHEVLKHRNPTIVTPIIARVADGLFPRELTVAGSEMLDDAVTYDTQHIAADELVHLENPTSIKWGRRSRARDHYWNVHIDGVSYSVGDTVIIEPGLDADRAREMNHVSIGAQTKNSLGNEKWFMRIYYLFEENGEKLCHGQWFSHGSKTVLQQTAHPQSLFLMNLCDDIHLASILQKCNLRFLAANEQEPPLGMETVENDFFCSMLWDEDECAFLDISDTETERALSHCEPHERCVSCGMKRLSKLREKVLPEEDAFNLRDVQYHIHDFVYLLSNGDATYGLAQVIGIKAVTGRRRLDLRVRYLARYDDVVLKELERDPELVDWKKDERRLFLTSEEDTVDAAQVVGKFYVMHLKAINNFDKWISLEDHFYIRNSVETSAASVKSRKDLNRLAKEDFTFCEQCHKACMQNLEEREALLSRNGPVQALELFAGAGGLSAGFDMSGFVQTKWAVEFSPSCCLTYQANHPHAAVYNQCSNLLLKHAIETHDGKEPAPLLSLRDNKTRLQPMPQPGEVDFIYGGLPCQSFSMANSNKKQDDIRDTLVCNMLSYVDFYKPDYFLLENVWGMVHHKIQGRDSEVAMAIIKFINRGLTSIGYQVHFKVLQAGHYGSPQARRRVIFWAARRGLPLPGFPVPTHRFEQRMGITKLANGKTLSPVTRTGDDSDHGAPLNPVKVQDAIGDLLPFDWNNPHYVLPSTTASTQESAERRARGIKAVSAESFEGDTYPGFADPVEYAYEPRTRYQVWIRGGEAGGTVAYHYTRRFPKKVIECVSNIPMKPNADHRSLPEVLRPERRGTGPEKVIKFGRIDWNGHFMTAMTTVAPNSRGSRVIHPLQKRILTVRECARAQGFPDHWRFLSVNDRPNRIVDDQYRQIGNAVPVPLARALGGALGETLLRAWRTEEAAAGGAVAVLREGSPEV